MSTGNLFVGRELFRDLGGFRGYRDHHGWDFCLRAAGQVEPVVVREPLCFHRVRAGNSIDEVDKRVLADGEHVLGEFLAAALAGADPCPNPLAPQWPGSRRLLLKEIMGGSLGAHVPAPALRAIAAEVQASAPQRRAAERAAPPDAGRSALVVLGVHRSGTSALTRVLNLCGAFLPSRVVPPQVDNNAKGFWEPEVVVELNLRTLGRLGGRWDRVPVRLPTDTEFLSEFESDVREVLASEYGDESTIVLKDPRISILAPLWQRALVAAGYRPLYVVPVRSPLEVARSLDARGNMSVREGLALWLTYMERIADFAAGNDDVVYVRFDELLRDWRGQVARIAGRFGIHLDAEARADEVDAFLESALRHQVSDEAELDALPDEPEIVAVRAAYRAALARCAGDVERSQRATATAAPRGAAATSVSADTACFVLCIEANAIREQALLLCASIRRFAGRHRDAPILAFAPRPGLGVDASTVRALAAMNVEYVDRPLNTLCPEYGSANRVFAAAWAERHAAADFVVVLDSDTVFLDEPELPAAADVAVRPADAKGSATSGPGDPFENYWAALAELGRTSLDRLPFLQTTLGGVRIRASYNGGLIVARRERGLLGRWAELFALGRRRPQALPRERSPRVRLDRRRRDGGKRILGLEPGALALTIWSDRDRVVHYPASYDVPLHLLAAEAAVDDAWLAAPPVHVHYHWMFGADYRDAALETLERLGVGADRLEWLAERTPLGNAEGAVREHGAVAMVPRG